ncbi:MAG TPA: phage major capsid protein, partial [Chroococcales cyanobacterium]
KQFKLSRKLLTLSPMPADQIVRDEMAYVLGITQENAFLNGNGVNQPLGIFTASTDGIDTSRDIASTNTAAALVPDGLIDALYGLKAQYQADASWVLHRLVVAQIRKMKDNYGQYLWQPSIQVGQPDMILGRPFYMSEYAPSTYTANAYIGMVGAFKAGYWILDAYEAFMQVLNELFSQTGQIGYISETYTEGAPVLAEAFVRLKLGAS